MHPFALLAVKMLGQVKWLVRWQENASTILHEMLRGDAVFHFTIIGLVRTHRARGVDG